MMARAFGLAMVLLLLATPVAWADGDLPKLITAADQAKLNAFDSTRSTALALARAKGERPEVALLNAALAGELLPVGGRFDARGRWRCRTFKLGGGLPLVVYPRFTCVISDDGSGWFLKKLSGSQRTQGRFYTLGPTRMVYLGAGTVNDDPPRHYGDVARENQVAIVERLGRNRLVLQFPKPEYESDFDLLVLERVSPARP
jgi:hypothetical protein